MKTFLQGVSVIRHSAVHGPSEEELLELAMRHVLLKSVILIQSVNVSEKDVDGIIAKILARGAGNEKMFILWLKASDQPTTPTFH